MDAFGVLNEVLGDYENFVKGFPGDQGPRAVTKSKPTRDYIAMT
jgi:hypothetical protein